MLLIAFVATSVVPTVAVPDEGMYTPDQIARLPLKERGLKINPLDLYNPNGPDISDAVVRLSIGCSAEFVSPKGLILTNHHCAFDALVSASSPGSDYAKDGFKADSMAQEMPAKNYGIFITNRVEDVTAKVTAGTEGLNDTALVAKIRENTENLTKAEQAKAPEGATIRIQSLNNGFFHYLYETQQIQDVRVVYAPPKSIGYFGGDPDNFEWSRHTGDFTFLRAYVSPEGKSAPYSEKNVPYVPKKFLSISVDGIKENDFTMVFGYPGGTTRYRESQAIEYAQNINYPFLVDYLTAWINGLVKAGENDEAKRIALQGEIFSLSNGQKLYGGHVSAMKRANLVAQKKKEEADLDAWINENPQRNPKADPRRAERYGTLLADIANVSEPFYKYGARDRLLRTLPNPNAMPLLAWLYDAVTTVKKGETLPDQKRAALMAQVGNREPVVEAEVARYFFKAISELPADQKFQTAEYMFGGKTGQARRDAESRFMEEIYGPNGPDAAEEVAAIYSMSYPELKARYADLVVFAEALEAERAGATRRGGEFAMDIDPLRLKFQQAKAEMKGTRPYPDANSTLRFSYGNVKGYTPREALEYSPITTLKGVIEKDTGVEPFDVPAKLKELQAAKDFGRWGVGDSVPVNFLTTNDIIGGNSGSPVLNANGEQIGIAFDGNYEGLGNDMFFDPRFGRTIVVDIRYVLFVTEKFGGAGWILDEMVLVDSRTKRKKK